MKLKGLLYTLFLSLTSVVLAQEKLVPLTYNPYVKSTPAMQLKASGTIDSTIQVFTYSNLSLPVWDDFSIDKFVNYDVNLTDPGVTSTLYYYLLDQTNTTALSPAISWCDSIHAHHDTITIAGGVTQTSTEYFTTAQSIWVNDLTQYPVTGEVKSVFQECYVLIDSVIDGVPDPTQDTIFYTSTPDYVQDSARVFTADVSNANEIWLDRYAEHNYRYAVDPKSLGVVTFDGAGEDGYPYAWGSSNSHGDADVLTSKPIDMSGATNVYLTFLYQAEGYGNMPDYNDSLILDVYSPSQDQWYLGNLFGVSGDDVTADQWYMVHIPISQSVLLEDGFQFRFRNTATTSGILDHWHIDYVHLRENSTAADTIIDDLAIMEPISSFLVDYTSVPWDHYKNLTDPNAVMIPTYELSVSNNHTAAKLQNDGQLIVDGNTYTLGVTTPNWSVGTNLYAFNVGSQPYTFPQIVPGDTMADFSVKMNVSTSSTNVYNINDTTYYNQTFRNYYAYDDGTAETGYGFEVYNAQLAYRFDAYESDTLTGVLMKFIPSNENISNNIFLLTVWADNDGEPGDIIYQEDYFYPSYPNYSAAQNQYAYYTFGSGDLVVVPETYYIGWEQIENDMLYIGMDFNNDNGDKIFYDTGAGWVNSAYQGSLIIRPVYSTALNGTLSTSNQQTILNQEVNINMYPNPTSNEITLEGLPDESLVKIYDLTGRLVQQSTQNKMDVSQLETAVYVVTVVDKKGELIFTNKMVKQ